MAVDGNVDPNFTIVMRGYERDEVDAYLRDVVAEATRLGERVAELEAELEAARARADSRSSPEEGFKHLGEETTRILVAAETAAREMREKAERQADAELAAAEKAARERVESASAHADRIVAEAESRQRDVEAEIRRLEDVRAEMVDRLRGAITTTEQAIATAPSVHGDSASAATPVGDAPAQDRDVATSPFEAAEAGRDEADRDQVEVEPAPGDDATVPADTEVGDAGGTSAAQPTESPAEATAQQDADAPSEAPAEDTETVTDTEDTAATEAVETTPAEEAAQQSAEAEEPHGGADRNALEAALAEADAAAGRAPSTETAPAAEETDAGMLRERSLAGVRPGMLRRLRRSLQELQNGVLESVRTRGEDTEVEALLPTDAEVAGLADVARIFLDAGYRAGRADGPVLIGGEALQDPPTDGTLVGDTADGLAEELLDELRTTLAPSLRAGVDAEEPDASLSERVGEVFRDLKGPVIETVVDRHLTRTYGRATLDGWSEAGLDQVRWILGEETRCPESMCRANQAEGAVDLGSEFPSGHAVPLAHDGCTCALEPA